MARPDEITRGRPSRIDRLPPDCDADVQWAIAEIKARRLYQGQILAELNERLRRKGQKAISRSALNRWALEGLRKGFAPRAAISAAPASNTGFLCPHCGGGLVVSAGLEGAVS